MHSNKQNEALEAFPDFLLPGLDGDALMRLHQVQIRMDPVLRWPIAWPSSTAVAQIISPTLLPHVVQQSAWPNSGSLCVIVQEEFRFHVWEFLPIFRVKCKVVSDCQMDVPGSGAHLLQADGFLDGDPGLDGRSRGVRSESPSPCGASSSPRPPASSSESDSECSGLFRTQVFVIHTYAITEFTILAVMSYDRYVAVCHPLSYHVIMSQRILPYCGRTIDKLYCLNYLLVQLACTSTFIVNIIGLLSAALYTAPQLIMIFYSYGHILKICIMSFSKSKFKALRTCIPHLLAVINYATGIRRRWSLSFRRGSLTLRTKERLYSRRPADLGSAEVDRLVCSRARYKSTSSLSLTCVSGPVQLVVLGLSLVRCSGGRQDGMEPTVSWKSKAARFSSCVRIYAGPEGQWQRPVLLLQQAALCGQSGLPAVLHGQLIPVLRLYGFFHGIRLQVLHPGFAFHLVLPRVSVAARLLPRGDAVVAAAFLRLRVELLV
ncbi:hypothetical protein CCH79_00002018 [Gambusia affinis]|uniref:G-protein coupled receptors family 1 profile domain-containing protein n=1 Tax=Gambusia affinis TaxID=33528 RepID=A0A315VTK1_GAMAF|nr:hypothetical protein CCH79_00002018 [Gambusia affinis]